jgi:hypothetical protein
MEIRFLDAGEGPDRFSTNDEIRAALSSFPNLLTGDTNERVYEIPSDMGGHVLIEFEEDLTLTLYERLDLTEN